MTTSKRESAKIALVLLLTACACKLVLAVNSHSLKAANPPDDTPKDAVQSALDTIQAQTETGNQRAEREQQETEATRLTDKESISRLLASADELARESDRVMYEKRYRGGDLDLDARTEKHSKFHRPEDLRQRRTAPAALQPLASGVPSAAHSREALSLEQQGSTPSGVDTPVAISTPPAPQAPKPAPKDVEADKKRSAPKAPEPSVHNPRSLPKPQAVNVEPTPDTPPIIYPIDAPGQNGAVSAVGRSGASPPQPHAHERLAQQPPTPPIPYPIDPAQPKLATVPPERRVNPVASQAPIVQAAKSSVPDVSPNGGKDNTAVPASAQTAPSLLSRAEHVLSRAWAGTKRVATSVWESLSKAWRSVSGSVMGVFDHFRSHEQTLQQFHNEHRSELEQQHQLELQRQLAGQKKATTVSEVTEQPSRLRLRSTPPPRAVIARTSASATSGNHGSTVLNASPIRPESKLDDKLLPRSHESGLLSGAPDRSPSSRIASFLRKLRVHELPQAYSATSTNAEHVAALRASPVRVGSSEMESAIDDSEADEDSIDESSTEGDLGSYDSEGSEESFYADVGDNGSRLPAAEDSDANIDEDTDSDSS